MKTADELTDQWIYAWPEFKNRRTELIRFFRTVQRDALARGFTDGYMEAGRDISREAREVWGLLQVPTLITEFVRRGPQRAARPARAER